VIATELGGTCPDLVDRRAYADAGRVVMPQHPASRSTIAPSFTPAEWDLLVRLPGRLLIAATSPEGAGGTHAQALAGLEAIAAGRASASRLVRDVVAAIYSEQAPADPAPRVARLADGVAGVLADCRAAARTVARRGGDADATAFREWLLAIATAVCAAGTPAGSAAAIGPNGARVTPLRRRFLVDLSLALTG